MKIRPARVLLPLLVFGMAAAAAAQPIQSRVETLPGGAKLAGPGVVYANSFFQERYMKVGRTIAYGLFVGGLYQQAVWRATGTYEGKAPVRQEANAFEALLGEFDVTAHVASRFHARAGEANHFAISLADDPALAEALVAAAAAEKKAPGLAGETPPDVVCAIKVSYGLGARAGREQMGFKKTYRPFVRLRAIVRRNTTGEVLWSGAVIAWGEKGYKGAAETDAKKIPREELVATFHSVADNALTLLFRSLNGETLEPMGELVDETKEDTLF